MKQSVSKVFYFLLSTDTNAFTGQPNRWLFRLFIFMLGLLFSSE